MSTLWVIATPIGNLEDTTFRAVRVLKEVDALACEDTRRTRILMQRHEIPRPRILLSYGVHNEERASKKILSLLDQGLEVALASDAGSPSISDPGYYLISQALEGGHEIQVLPGADAPTTALIVSGLPSSSYTFKGFAPKKSGKLQRFLEMERDLPHSLIIFVSPYRVGKFLSGAMQVLGDRRAAVCLELTKKFEEVSRGHLTELAAAFADKKVKGEVTVVIAGSNPKMTRAAEPIQSAQE